MGKIRRGVYVLVWWKGDHTPRHVHVFRDGRFIVKLHLLTVAALKRVEASGLSRRELARRLGTSVPQVYRLLDPANMRKSFVQLVALLDVVDCDVRVSVRRRRAVAA